MNDCQIFSHLSWLIQRIQRSYHFPQHQSPPIQTESINKYKPINMQNIVVRAQVNRDFRFVTTANIMKFTHFKQIPKISSFLALQ